MQTHTCHSCGAPAEVAGVRLYQDTSAADADADLRRQAREAHRELRPIINAVRAQLAREDAHAQEIGRDLDAAYKEVLRALDEALSGKGTASNALRARLAGSNAAQIRSIIEGFVRASIDPVQIRALQRQADEIEIVRKVFEDEVGHRVGLNLRAVGALVDQQAMAFWQDRVTVPAVNVITEGFISSTSLERLEDVTDRIATTLEKSTARAKTDARTQIATFDRTVNEEAGVAAGLTLRWYMGPMDGITRPFCKVLVGKVLTLEQAAGLNNSQTAASPIFTGGGFNCRHRLVAVSERTVERRSLAYATDADVQRANAAAAGDR